MRSWSLRSERKSYVAGGDPTLLPSRSASGSSSSSFATSLDSLKRRVYIAIFTLVCIAASLGSYLGTSLSGSAWVDLVFGYVLAAFSVFLLFLAAVVKIPTTALDRITLTSAMVLVPLRTAAFVFSDVEGDMADVLSETGPWYGTVFILIFVMMDRRKAKLWSAVLYVELLILGVIYLIRNASTVTAPVLNVAAQSLVLANATYIVLLLILTRTKEAYTRSTYHQVRLAALAATDELTGIPNRRSFLTVCDQHVRDLRDEKGELSIIMLDVDHFKEVNDSHGHAIGDLVLRRVAKVLQDNARDTDMYGRLGGEEFGVLVPGTGMDIARIVAERLRTAIEAAHTPEVPAVTASLGVAEWEEGDTTDTLMERADRALYHAKAEGRNRVSAMYEYQLPGSKAGE